MINLFLVGGSQSLSSAATEKSRAPSLIDSADALIDSAEKRYVHFD
ncbi:MAG: hypothetical protein ACOX16_04040 [Candidatus Izemoplasmatales bacterium]|jgi:hypothetical protein